MRRRTGRRRSSRSCASSARSSVDGTTHHLASERLTIEPFDLDRPGPHRAGHRPARALVLPPARVAEEGRAGQRHLPAQQPVHVPVDGEALGVLRDAPARPQGAEDDPGALQEPGRQPPLDLHEREVQPSRSTSTCSPSELGYPLYMKPFDGGGWRGVSRIDDPDDLHRAYDESGEMLMHLQATVELRPLRPRAVDRARDDGDGLPARPADAQPVRRHATTS